ncbi:MAG TPA: inositol monophosphatase [Gammaproteobacteria bacterium]|nr:inositol monophosphatase [Gammaproteobacteria bacterium]
MHPFVNTAVKAARRAGSIIVRHLDRLDRIDIEKKGHNDYVSEVDHKAETEILAIIQQAYPDHAIVAEESGQQPGTRYEWIIDPLDGTTNFLHGYPQFAVSIAVREAGRITHGVIFDPLRNELFTASRGGGARLNDRRIRISHCQNLEYALLGTGFPFRDMLYLEPWLSSFREMLIQTSGIRRAGSAALDLAHLACGRFDGFWEFGLSIWDIAAGCLLIEEAGGLISGPSGSVDHLDSGHIVAGNPYLHPQILEIIRNHLPEDFH